MEDKLEPQVDRYGFIAYNRAVTARTNTFRKPTVWERVKALFGGRGTFLVKYHNRFLTNPRRTK